MRFLSLGQQRILFLLALVILTLLYFRFFYHPLPFPSMTSDEETVVEVSGDVQSPGIYIFSRSPTLREAIEKAGGLKDASSLLVKSFLETLETGTRITVVKESAKELRVKIERMGARKLLVFSIPLDLNQATAEDLCLIPGIGDSLAQEIVIYRDRKKGFRRVEELKDVKGVGEKKFNALKTFLTVK